MLIILNLWLLFMFVRAEVPVTDIESDSLISGFTENVSVSMKRIEEKFEEFAKLISKTILSYFIRNSNYNISPLCSSTLLKIIMDLRKLKLPVIKMLDAMPKPPYGLLKGVLSIMGDYDECLEVKVNKKGDFALTEDEEIYHGQYCLVETELAPALVNGLIDYQNKKVNISAFGKLGKFYEQIPRISFEKNDIVFKVGICMPSTCSATDLQELASLVPLPFYSMRVKHCDDGRFQQLNVGQIIFISFLVILSIFVVSGTILEMFSSLKTSVFRDHKSKIAQFFLAFSFYTNAKKFMKLKRNSSDSQIPAINGMYVIGSLFVIIYHTYFMPFSTSFSSHALNLTESFHDWKFTIMMTMGISIDAFFLFSAIFLAYPRFRTEEKQVKINIFKIIVQRYLRFCPSMMVIVGLIVSLPLIGSGPVWSDAFGVAAENSRKWWWTYVLMFNNFLTVKDQSFFPLWFIPCLMQITVIGVILLWFISKNPKIGITLTIATCLCCNIVLGLLTYIRNYPLTYAIYYFSNRAYFETTIYTSPLSHVSSYGIGLLLGYFMAKHPTLKLSRNYVIAGWITSFFFIFGTHMFCFIGHEGVYFDPTLTSVYAASHRILYTLGMSWIVLACKYGYGGALGEFLSWKGFAVLAKLSYSGYLLHYIVISYHVSSTRVPLAFSHYEIFIRYSGYITVSLIASYFFYITFELPMMYVESLLFPRKVEIKMCDNISNQVNGKYIDNGFFKENGVLDSNMFKPEIMEQKLSEISKL